MRDSGAIQPLDVHEMEPPEPLTAILGALESLAPKALLKVRHRREPLPLYPMLAEMGYVHRSLKKAGDEYRIYIWRAGETALEASCAADIDREKQS